MPGGAIGAVLQEAGAAVVNLPASERAPAIATGVIDGVVAAPDFGLDASLGDALSGAVLFCETARFGASLRMLYANSYFLADLPDDLRSLIISTTGPDLSAFMGGAAEQIFETAANDLVDRFGEGVFLSEAEEAAWRAFAAPVIEAELVEPGPDARDL